MTTDEQVRLPPVRIGVTYGPRASIASEVGITEAWRWTALARFGPHFPVKFLARTLGCPWEDITALAGDFEAPSRAMRVQVPAEYYRQYLDAVARIEAAADATFAAMRSEHERLKGLGDRNAFAAAVRQIPDAAVQHGVFLLRDGLELTAELRAWASVRPAHTTLFVHPG
jgi:RNA ligase